MASDSKRHETVEAVGGAGAGAGAGAGVAGTSASSGSSGGGAAGAAHARDAELETDATLLVSLEDELAAIDDRFRSTKMRAFGDFNKAVLDSFDRVRAQQAKLFVDHYTLETEFAKTGFEQPVQEFARSRYEDNEFGTNKPFCESLPQAFETCSQKVDNITSSVEHLSNMVSKINAKVDVAFQEDAATDP